ncbi:TrmH family RNA methyltransferase [Treponema sp.]|uniref:TrmH family RNA methyltransferase n=1 Tax=Treponema sp. TaxID=166 RepID=UPI003F0928BA
MINPAKLFQLEPGQKRRKLALTFGELERDIAGIAEHGMEYRFSGMSRQDYTKTVARIVLEDPKLPEAAAAEIKKLIEAEDFDERRLCNVARNSLLAVIGTFPAEWDLVIAPHAVSELSVESRSFFKGVNVYAEDIRSPFNIGSIFRTAEAMGCEHVYISPNCTDPYQPRALRSGMGCVETMGFCRCPLEELPGDMPVFVLETGGTPITEFSFPKEGIVIIGSEELGVSPEALKRATCGIVSIPMTGLKASLNVGVAFGILMQAWVQSLSSEIH